MADRRRGKPSNYQLPAGLAERAVQIIRERYANFGPTLACEKLAEQQGVVSLKHAFITITIETQLIIRDESLVITSLLKN